jgi:hypothetical protein
MSEPLTIRIFGRRRNLLVNSPYQHRVSLITTLLALLPPAIFFSIYYLITSEGSRRIVEANPSLEQMVRGQDRTESLLILAAVLIYGLGVYLVTLLESHRTAGFLYRVNRSLTELRDGTYGGQVRPRKDDNFTYLAGSLNALSQSLKSGVEEDLAAVDEINRSLESAVASAGSASGHLRDRLLEVRSRLQAFRRLKRSHLGEDAPPLPLGMPQVGDAPVGDSEPSQPPRESVTP